MDYLQEELEGQRRLWSALLLGKSHKAEREAETAEVDAVRPEEQAHMAERLRGMALAEETAKFPTAQALPGLLARRSRRERLAAGRALGLAPEEPWAAGDEGTAGVGETQIQQRPWAQGGEAGNPKALSRAFQRDARRYDGGFSLY